MRKLLWTTSLLLASTAIAGPALAQVSGGSTSPGGTQPPVGEDVGEPPAEDAGEDVDISAPGADFGGDIVVQGRNIPNPVRNSTTVISVLSAEDIARTGEGDIASALNRVTGLSVDSGGFVYVRGLGDRYSQALLNGLPIPSPEPLKRVVPLDIFPTSVLSSATVQKSYSVNYPGEFGGGLINLTTSITPDESFLTIGGGVSANTVTTFELGYTHYGSDSDFTGFDDGTRDIPRGLERALDSGVRVTSGDQFSNADLITFGQSLVNAPTTLLQRNFNIPANGSIDVSAGHVMDVGAAEVGLIANFGYSNDWFTRGSIEQDGGNNGLNQTGRAVRTDNNIVVSGLVGASAEIDRQKLRFTALYIRDTLKQSSLYSYDQLNFPGDIDPTTPDNTQDQRTSWIERQLLDLQLVGEFKFGDWGLDLRGGYANSQREEPYERRFQYVYNETVDDYTNALAGGNDGFARVAFGSLDEDVWSGAIDVSYAVPSDREITLSGGYAYSDTQRTGVRREFQYQPLGTLPIEVAQLRPDFLLSDFILAGGFSANGAADGIVLQEINTTAGQQAYDAALTVHGAYAKVQAEVVPFVTVDVGVRYETAEQSVNAINLYGDDPAVVGSLDSGLDNDYWLPAATVTWNFAEDMQLRAAASKTIARPQFRELARPLYFDPQSNRDFQGNPLLQDSQLYNAELRYEWFFDRGQRFGIAGFYKKIDNPIEPFTTRPGGGDTITSFLNAPEASLYGVEVEAVKYFPLDSWLGGDFWASRRLVLIANYTYTKSELKVNDGDTVDLRAFNLPPLAATGYFEDGSPLTGQSEHLANLQVGIEDTERLSQITILGRYASDRITQRGELSTGTTRNPNFVEDPGIQIDIVARQGVMVAGKEVEVKLEARNIFGEEYEERLDGTDIITNGYDLGTTFKASLGVKF